MVAELRAMKLKEAAKKIEDGIEETLTYCDFPSEHWTRIRTNNVIERLNREIRRRTRVVGTFPDGNSAPSPEKYSALIRSVRRPQNRNRLSSHSSAPNCCDTMAARPSMPRRISV